MNRDYEFFVTTDEPRQPEGEERGAIRRLVMRNFFESKWAGPQPNVSEQHSASTVTAKKQLKNRFRLPKIEDDPMKSVTEDRKGKTKGERSNKKCLKVSTGIVGRSKEIPPISRATTQIIRVEKDKKESESREVNDSWSSEEKLLLRTNPDTHRLDPFDVLPVPGTRQLDTLFRLFKGSPKTNSIAIDASHTWKTFVLNDAGLLHATLATWALYGMQTQGLSELRVEQLRHKNEAIKVINCKIAASGGNISDELVGTVLTLANFENLHGDYNAAQLHTAALKRMVNARGGLSAFRHNDGLLRGIIWMDFHTAAVFHKPPSYPRICLDPDSPSLPDELMQEAACTSPTSLLQLPVSAIDCFNIFYRLHRLALAISSQWLPTVSRLTLSSMLYETQFIILSVPDGSREFRDFDLAASDGQTERLRRRKYMADAASVVEALLAAALIFVYAALRGLPPNAKILTILLNRLRWAMDRPHISIIEIWTQANNLNMLPWVLIIGCSFATGQVRAWWIMRIYETCENLGIKSQHDLEQNLRHVAWTDKFFKHGLDRLWAEIVRLRGHAAADSCTSVMDQDTVTSSGHASDIEHAGIDIRVQFERGRWKVDNWYI